MKYERNENNKIVLLNREGKEAYFDYDVDAREALGHKEKDGNPQFTIPVMKRKFFSAPPAAKVPEPPAMTPKKGKDLKKKDSVPEEASEEKEKEKEEEEVEVEVEVEVESPEEE